MSRKQHWFTLLTLDQLLVLVYSGKSLVYSISIEKTGIMKYNKHNETETLRNIRKEVLKMGGFWDFIFGR